MESRGDLEVEGEGRELEEGGNRREEAEHRIQGANYRKHMLKGLRFNKLINFLIIPNMGLGSNLDGSR